MTTQFSIPPLPGKIVGMFQHLRFDPQATCSYEILSGGLMWPDEISPELIKTLTRHQHPVIQYLYRYLWAYRASLIKEKEREEFRQIWEMVFQQAPGWPGFRTERLSTEHKALLIEGEAALENELRMCQES